MCKLVKTVVFQLWIHKNFNWASGRITWGAASNRKFSSTDFELTTLTLWCSGMMKGNFQIRRRNLNQKSGRSHSKHGNFFFCTWEGNHLLNFWHRLTKRVCWTTKDFVRPFCSWHRFAWRHKWRPRLSGVLFHADSKDLVNCCLFKVIFVVSTMVNRQQTTIWGICLFPAKSKIMMRIKLPFSRGPPGLWTHPSFVRPGLMGPSFFSKRNSFIKAYNDSHWWR